MNETTFGSTSSSLIRGLRESEPEAWGRMAKLYAPTVYAWCRHAGLAEADVPDVAQDVFLSVHRGIGSFRQDRPGDTFHGWLWTITRNAVLAVYRRRKNRPLAAAGGTDAQQALGEIPEFLASDDPPPRVGTQAFVVRRALATLREEFQEHIWKAFWRTTIDGRPGAEVADELEMTPVAVRQAKHRVLKRLRDFLAED